MAHCRQRFFLRVFTERTNFAQKRRNIANQAQSGGNHQKHHDDNEPRRGVHVVQTQKAENLRPKWAEFYQIIDLWLVLLQDRTDNRSHAQQAEQGDGKTHGAEKGKPWSTDKWDG